MDFELSEQQTAFRDLMRDFTRKSIAPVAREWELAGRYPEEIVEEMKAMGLFGMLVPEAYGGMPPASADQASRSPSRRRAATCRESRQWRGAMAITTS